MVIPSWCVAFAAVTAWVAAPWLPAAAPEAEKWELCVVGREHVKASHGIGEDEWPS